MTTPLLTVMTTIYKSEQHVERFVERVLTALKSIGCDSFELLFVIDGSPDRSLAILQQLQQQVPAIVMVEFTRNFGQHYAAHAGLLHSRGQYVFWTDSDLEVDPMELVRLWETRERTQADVVYGFQERRKGAVMERVAGGWFYRLFNALSETQLPYNMLVDRVMTRDYVEAVLRLGDLNIFLGGMMIWAGFRQVGIPIVKTQRAGESTYNFSRRLGILVNALTSFSSKPLLLLLQGGVGLTLLSLLALLALLVKKVTSPAVDIGWLFVVAIQFLTLGLATTATGVVALYLSKMFVQVQGRPRYLIRKVHRTPDPT